MEDALISPESFSILSGAGLVSATESAPIYTHTTSQVQAIDDNIIELPELACWDKYERNGEYEKYRKENAGIFVMMMKDGEICAEPCIPVSVTPDEGTGKTTLVCYSHSGRIEKGDVVLVDYYIKKTGKAQQIEITPDKFGGYYYVEASCLFRRESDGLDLPAEFVIPKAKVQSNFTFSMAATGDPSTFNFVLDAFPDYTKFDMTHKVLAAIQVLDDDSAIDDEERTACTPTPFGFKTDLTEGLMVEFDNESTDDNIELIVSGSAINGISYSTDNWGTDLPKDVYIAEMGLEIPVEPGKSYSLVTRSPLHVYYKDDPRIFEEGEGTGRYYKEQNLMKAPSDIWDITVGLSNKKGPVTFELYELDAEGAKKMPAVRKVSIQNHIGFAGRANVVVLDEGTKMGDMKVNDETVENFDMVVVGDTLCFTATGAKTVKINNNTIYPNASNVYTYKVIGNTTITVL